jgi:hypothetical protein
MPYVLNPFTGKLDATSGGTAVISDQVSDPTALPITLGTPPIGTNYLAAASSGVWLVNYKASGIYRRTANAGAASDWTYLGSFPGINADANWQIYDDASPTRTGQFDLGSVTAGQNRVLTWPNASGVIVLGNDSRIANIAANSINTTDSDGTNFATIGPSDICTSGDSFFASFGGFINTRGADASGGNIDTSCHGTDERGGNIYTYSEGNDGVGGDILTHGGSTGAGGSLNTSNGGGSINTRGTGSIGLGVSGTRTTLTGTATANRAISLPNAAGTIALTSQLAETRVYTANDTWTKPTGAKLVHYLLIGGGGGGGSGRRSSSFNSLGGGGGGAGGGITAGFVDPAFLGSTESITIGAGGTGAVDTADNTNGAGGTAGGESSFGSSIKARGGAAGGGGSSSAGAAGAATTLASIFYGTNASTAAGALGGGTTGATAVASVYLPTGGGGGGARGGGVNYLGGKGGDIGQTNTGITSAPAVAAGTSGPAGIRSQSSYAGTGGGGGSMSSDNGVLTGFVGGAGGTYGGGGGGGSGAGNASGGSSAGGTGGAGIVIVTTYF